MANAYVIRRERDFFGPRTVTDLVPDHEDPMGAALRFETEADAQEWIDRTYDAPYYLSHNESGRPAYKIVRADRLPKRLASFLDNEEPELLHFSEEPPPESYFSPQSLRRRGKR